MCADCIADADNVAEGKMVHEGLEIRD
jgi:hypothetical protein